jgi:hypothetical protein
MTSLEISSRRELPERYDITAVAALSALIIFYAHFRAFISPYVINDDVRQQIFWMQQWRDPALYPSDWIVDYARHYVPWGIQWIYWPAAHIMNPVYFSKVLTAFIFIWLSVSFFSMGKMLGGRQLGWIAVGVSWITPFYLDNFSGGLSRSFAAPLMMMFLLGWLRKDAWTVGIALFLQAVLIPYIFGLCAFAACLAWLARRLLIADEPPFPSRIVHFVILAAASALVLLMYRSLNHAGLGPLVTYKEMLGRPEFTEAGRYQMIPVPSLLFEALGVPVGYMGLFLEYGDLVGAISLVAIIAVCVAGVIRREWKPLGTHLQPFIFLGIGSIILYYLARLVLLKLFVPSRYVETSANICFCMVVALCLQGLLKNRRLGKSACVAAILIVATLSAVRLHGVGIFDYSAYKPLYDAVLKDVPKDAVVAGSPDLMDNVITFGRRRVFASGELAHPWCKGYWKRLEPRLEELFKAYYAEEPDSVIRFSRQHKVDFIVVDDRDFLPSFINGQPFFAPFDKMIRKDVGGRATFALLEPGAFKSIKVDDHIHLIDMRPYKEKK